jgi:hypothetical protein
MMGAPVCEVVDTQLHFGTLMPFRVGASIPLLSGDAVEKLDAVFDLTPGRQLKRGFAAG